MSASALEREIKFNIKLFAMMARQAQRSVKKLPSMAGHSRGMRDAYMICARSLKGHGTQAKVVNAILRTVGV